VAGVGEGQDYVLGSLLPLLATVTDRGAVMDALAAAPAPAA
jgi:hypothetical protein